MKRGFWVAVLGILSFLGTANLSMAQGRYYDSRSWGDGAGRQVYNQGRPGRNDGYYDRDRQYRNDYGRRDYDYGYRDDGYYRRDRSAGKSVAIVGGSAAAGAAIGAVSGGGKGAAVGAVIGGVTGLIIDQTTRHRHHY